MSDNNILEMKSISKIFPGVRALDHVDFSVRHGEVHALMGENGAGKSTLIKILTGIYQKDDGEMIFNGQNISPKSALQAQQHGISTIYQELNLIPYLSVSENVFLGRYPKNKRGIDWNAMHKQTQRIVNDMEIDVDVHKPLQSLGTAVQQMVAIARAISFNAKLVVMDEPTSSLDKNEVKVLFNIIKKLKEKGIATIFISHRLDEVYEVADRITILKDGQYIGTYASEALTKYELIKKMVGKDQEQKNIRCKKDREFSDEYVVSLQDIYKSPKVNGVTFGIKKGEVLGLAGLLGSGRTETAKILFGYDRPDKGSLFIDDKKVKFKMPKQAIKNKLAFCTEDRREEGIIPNMSIKQNMTLALLPEICKFGFVSRKKQNEMTQKYIDYLNIKTPNANQLIKNLSGGNQQKVVLSRWLCTNPRLIILDEPTRGIDVGAKGEIEKLIEKFADSGISVLLISSELQELVRNCNRVLVIREGTIIGEIIDSDISEDNIMEIIARDHNSFS